ncbi:alpha/beta fold hydrolase [Kitasatospora sp. RB6PN24]|uniref:alpha/beta hydrolase n=1 Tax=Kitasatospora humi TaxID=2893891 RepID=UPI001E4D87D2|nr:alpha/beta fold hydrolase [Kitasatospora humi]MCC9307440.1 alpha/beta fold hydrolase [Kitasatospora humi]
MSSLVRPEKVTFTSGGTKLVGNLYRPTSAAAGPAPAVVVTGTWTSVKEQMAARYAAGLAAAGYTALAFDFSGSGESDGTPRDWENPAGKVAEIAVAADHLRSLPGVDADRIGGLGVCAGAGYTAVAAARGAGFRSLAMIAPWLHDAEVLAGLYGGSDVVDGLIARGEAAARKYRETGEVDYVPTASTDDERSPMYGSFDYYLDSSRGAVPQWPNRFAVMGWADWLTFDPIAVAPEVAVPTVLVHSREAAIPEGVDRFHAALTAPNELHWLTGGQFDFYDNEPTVTAALDLAAAHFGRTL